MINKILKKFNLMYNKQDLEVDYFNDIGSYKYVIKIGKKGIFFTKVNKVLWMIQISDGKYKYSLLKDLKWWY